MSELNAAQRIAENWNAVRQEVADAARLHGRREDEVTIVGVTKYVTPEIAQLLVDAGCLHLGENRPQMLWQKAESISTPGLRWHLIGHLQRNKIRRTLPFRPWIHSVDSERVVEALSVEATQLGGEPIDVLLEVNISGDATKTGLALNEIRHLLSKPLPDSLRCRGLMAMAGLGTDMDESRRQFANVRQLRESLQQEFGVTLLELSMGMSGDFVEAIAEGATLVRIGSRLFEGVLDPKTE